MTITSPAPLVVTCESTHGQIYYGREAPADDHAADCSMDPPVLEAEDGLLRRVIEHQSAIRDTMMPHCGIPLGTPGGGVSEQYITMRWMASNQKNRSPSP